MPSVDSYSIFFGDILVALGFLCLKIETWTNGKIGWGIASCIFGFAFVFRESFALQFVLFLTTFPWS